MSWVAVGVGAVSLVGTVAGGVMGSNAAGKAGGAQQSAFDSARMMLQNTSARTQSLMAPYQLYGTSALSALRDRVYSSTERQKASIREMSALQAEVDRLSQPIGDSQIPLLSGKSASERRAVLASEMRAARSAELQTAIGKLDAYKKEQELLAPLEAQAASDLAVREGRVTGYLERINKLSNLPESLSGLREMVENDPVYKFRQAEGERAINRAATARGSFFSGAAINSLSDFNLALTGEETDKYVQRQATALSMATTGLTAEMGEDQRDIANMQQMAGMGLTAAQTDATGQAAMAGAQANLAVGAGQAQAQTIMQQNQALQSAIGGASSTVGMLGSMAMYKNMMAPTSSKSAVEPTVFTRR